MLKKARQYNIHLPLFYNDGRRIEPEKFEQVETLVSERYGGFTSIRQETPLRGSWRGEERIYTDMIIVISVISAAEDFTTDEEFFTQYKEELEGTFEQEEIFITVQALYILKREERLQ